MESWADQIGAGWNVLPMDIAAFREWASLMHRRSDDLIEDAMIAATARVHGLKVVTRNIRDFSWSGCVQSILIDVSYKRAAQLPLNQL
jgi:toxin FitB